MDISITKAEPEHTEEISSICSIGWRQTVQGIYSEEYQIKNVEYWYNLKKVKEDIVKGVYTHVAMVDQTVVGTIGGVMTEPSASEIYVFYIDENYRFKGIGKKLLDAFTKDHIRKGATDQYVSVQDGNSLGIPFYKLRGFQQKAENERYWRKLDREG
ncbi:GNAT family N-acetyltransferase [Alkalibacillus silvisoli]|uniref:N-acetyltransferase domain-containing protein n=1 Tax=Alkalibacillus silvisoli TaxID=392823 RepID=A0ABN0ZUM6_9BACI